jgi:acyl transferase domain-containing protein/acyl-CoA synthetase (AMP-forming)/AMP-acid ligase II/aryl carrier-like protein
MPAAARTLADLLRDGHGGSGIRFITGAEQERFRPYADIADAALRVLAALLARGLAPGAEVVIALADPEAFVLAFWACILGRMVPIPVQPPGNDEHRLKLARILDLLQRPFLLADRSDVTVASASLAELLAEQRPLAVTDGAADADDVAFVQFSSGSTGDPKGVVLTHRQLLTHLADFAASARMDAADVFLSWFPLTHDMGLIGWHLLPLALGAGQCLMPTRLFVQRPSLWLAKASQHRATVLTTNNFGIKHFLKLLRPETASGWDLSAVRLLFNAAEPISADLCQEFQARLAPHGLAPAAMFPGYGLAEATLGVTFPVPGETLRLHRLDRHLLGLGDSVRPAAAARDEVTLVELGRPIEGVAIRVVDGEGAVLADRQVGAVEIQSRSMARGYLRNEAANAALFAPDGWMRTGDAGFLAAGRLVLTGRIKEIIIQAGQNYYPQDLERLAEGVAGVELGKVVACGIADSAGQRELLVLFVQTRQALAEFLPLARALRAQLMRKGGLLVDHVLPVAAVPKTSSGKIERYRLAQRFLAGAFDAAVAELAALEQRDSGRAAWRRASGAERHRLLLALLRQGAEEVLDTTGIALDRSLFEQGLDSRRVISLHAWLENALGVALPVSLPFERPSLADLAACIEESADGDVSQTPAAAPMIRSATAAEPIAIVGIGCRFPGGADRLERFWEKLCDGIDAAGWLPPGRGAPAAPVAGCFLPDVAGFDHGFFHLSPREAEALDPQARLLLEVAWEALEDAGQDIPCLAGIEVGVFVGIGNTDYALAQLHGSDPDRIGPYAYTGSAPSLAVGRIAHVLGFEGPALAVDTACSSSLVAVHLAAASLRAGDCAVALAGGVNLILAPAGHVSLGRLGALSAGGVCRPFDDGADGYLRGEGCGMVVLKPLAAARADGDRILALLLASAINHDGRSSGLTVPSGPAQVRVIRRALHRAGLAPAAIGYLEAHGTGTPLGDPIEVRALDAVFGPRPDGAARLPIGSVKGNIGHLESAAGIAGLIKAVLALRHGTIPPSLHLATPNRHLPWETLAVRVAGAGEPWPQGEAPRRAGVSAFGFAGTNAHVVLQEAPPAAPSPGAPSPAGAALMPLSAASAEALRALAGRWRDFAAAHPDCPPADLAATASRRRSHLAHRAALRCAGRDDLLRRLEALAAGEATAGMAVGRRRADRLARLGFVYAGQGPQWAGAGAELMRLEPVFRDAIASCDALIAPLAGWSVAADLERPPAESLLARTDRAQAAIFALQHALTVLLAHYGVVPDCVAGHSCGEIAALLAAGLLTLEQVCRVVVARGRLMQAGAGQGAMLAVQAPVAEFAPLLCEQVELAAVNSPVSAVLAVAGTEVTGLTRALEARSLPWRRLDVDFAFHSRQMEDAGAALSAELADLAFAPARIPLYSTALGRRLAPGEPDASYWQANVRDPVRFADAVAAMRDDDTTHFLEIGPHAVLARALAECLEGHEPEPKVIATLRRGQGQTALHDALGALYAEGFDLRWDRLHAAPPPLPEGTPLYPWQRARLWQEGFDPWSPQRQAAAAPPGGEKAARHAVVWRLLPSPRSAAARRRGILVLADPANALAPDLARRLGATLRTCRAETVGATLGNVLAERAERPEHILLLADGAGAAAEPPRAQRAAFGLLLGALGVLGRGADAAPALWLVTVGTEAPSLATPLHQTPAARAMPTAGLSHDALWALARSAAVEYPELGCRRVDLSPHPDHAEMDLLGELLAAPALADAELALRGRTLYAARLARAEPGEQVRTLRVSAEASYLVTGGCGSLGLIFARMLVARGARTLVLLGRGGARAEAEAPLAALAAAGARVLLRQADVANAAALAGVLAEIDRDLPPLAGVVHAAGVLEDGMLAALDPRDPLAGAFGRVLAPKLDGGWNLHLATRGRALDFTVLVSSASLLLGSPGQGAYAAANGFLDALAAWRCRNGLPTLSLRLGIVAGSTMAARAAASGRDLAAEGVPPLSEAELLAALPALWGEGQPTATLLALRAEDWLARYPSAAAHAWFAPLLSAPAEPAEGAASLPSPAERFGTGPASVAALRRELTAIVASVIHAPAGDLAPDQPLRELGVDSLMTLQIRNEIVRRLGCAVRITAFWAHPTIDAFARHLAGELGLLAAAPPAPEPTAPPRSVREALADKWEKYL